LIPAAFSVGFDHEQVRVSRHPIYAMIAGEQFSSPYGDDTWVDPITNCASLRPMCRYLDWTTSNSGMFAKPAKSAYDFDNSANWNGVEKYVGAGLYMQTDTAGGWIRTKTAPGKNRGVNLAFFGYGAGDAGKIGTFGWHDTDLTVAGSTVSGEIYADGTVSIYKGGIFVKNIRLSFGQSAASASNQSIEILFMPQRRKELLLTTPGGSGGVCVFEDIAEDEASPVITPNAKFWFKPVSTATSAQIQIAPAVFDAEGYITSDLINFARPPATGATLTAWLNPIFSGITNAGVYGDAAFAGTCDVSAVAIRNSTDSGAFTPDGTTNAARLRITMTSGGSYTPFIYGCAFQYDGATALTDDSEESSPDEYMRELVINVADSAFGSTIETVYKNPDALEAIVPKLRRVSNRPAKLTCGSLILADGRTRPTRYHDSLTDDSKEASIQILDMTAALKELQYRDSVVFDGSPLSQPVGSGSSLVRKICNEAGIDDSLLVLGDAGYMIDAVPGQKCGEWSFYSKPGETGEKILERAHQQFAASWFMGIRPSASGPQFWFVDVADLPSTPVIKLYRNEADAIADGVASEDAWVYVYTVYSDEAEDVDANEVWATGIDNRTGQIVQAYSIDTDSQDATLAPSLRPDNWIGSPKLFGVRDPRLRTQSACARTVEYLAPIVSDRPVRGEFATPGMLWYDSGGGVMLPVWRGDLVELDGIGEVRIVAHETEVLLNDLTLQADNSRYTFGAFSHSGGTAAQEIRDRARARKAGSIFDILGFGFFTDTRTIRRS